MSWHGPWGGPFFPSISAYPSIRRPGILLQFCFRCRPQLCCFLICFLLSSSLLRLVLAARATHLFRILRIRSVTQTQKGRSQFLYGFYTKFISAILENNMNPVGTRGDFLAYLLSSFDCSSILFILISNRCNAPILRSVWQSPCPQFIRGLPYSFEIAPRATSQIRQEGS